MSEQYPNQNSRPTAASDGFPPQFAPMVDRLASDGVMWQSRLPDAERAAARMRAIPATIPYTGSEAAPHTRIDRVIPRTPPSLPPASDPEPPGHGPGARALGVVGAVVVVALLIAVFAQISSTRKPPSPAATVTPPATAAPTATDTPSVQPATGLVHVAGLDTVSNPTLPAGMPTGTVVVNQPVVAPSDATIAYVAGQYDIQRVVNGTRTKLPVPAGPANARLQWTDLFVSPLSSNAVFATAALVDDQGNPISDPQICALAGTTALVQPARTGGNVLASPAIGCHAQYFSTDGGQHWQPVHLPNGVFLGTENDSGAAPRNTTPLAVIGTRIYGIAGAGPGPNPNGTAPQLVVSDDGGVSWQTVSGPFTSAGRACALAASPDGRALYLLMNAAQGCSNGTQFWQPNQSLWRSLDVGATWAKVSLPTSGYIASIACGGPQDTLIAISTHGQGAPVAAAYGQSIYASGDGGVTWTTAPTAGLPTGSVWQGVLATVPPAPATLRDGTLVLPFFTLKTLNDGTIGYTSPVLMSLRPGTASWQQVATFPSTLPIAIATTLSSVSNGHQVLSLVLADAYGGATVHFSVYQAIL